MGNSKRQEKINKSIRQYVDSGHKLVRNASRLSRHNSDLHELAKTKKTLDLMREGKEVYTEVYLVGGGIADIFVPEDYRVFEILASETEEECLTKTLKYPFGLDIITLDAEEIMETIK